MKRLHQLMCRRQFVVSVPPTMIHGLPGFLAARRSSVQPVDAIPNLPSAAARGADIAAVLDRPRPPRALALWERISDFSWSDSTSIGTLFVVFVACALTTALYMQALTAIGATGVDPTAMFAIFTAASVSSIAGFAFSPLCGALLVHIIGGPVRIVQILLICSIGMQALMVWTLRSSIPWRLLARFLAGGVAGLPIGLWLLLHLPQAAYAHALGVLIVGCGGWRLLRRHVVLPRRYPAGDIAAGVCGGVTGGLAGFPSAFATIWCGMQGWDKVQQRSLVQPFILSMQVVTLGALYLTGSAGHGVTIDISAWAYLPAALLGSLCGLAVFSRLSETQFAVAANVLLVVSGFTLAI
jgi:uncharacterized membrane protein YfcA